MRWISSSICCVLWSLYPVLTNCTDQFSTSHKECIAIMQYKMDTWIPGLTSDDLVSLAVRIVHSHCGDEIFDLFLPCSHWVVLSLPQHDFQFPWKNIWLMPTEHTYPSAAQGQVTRMGVIYLYIDLKCSTRLWIWSSLFPRETIKRETDLGSIHIVELPVNRIVTRVRNSKDLANSELSLTTCIFV